MSYLLYRQPIFYPKDFFAFFIGSYNNKGTKSFASFFPNIFILTHRSQNTCMRVKKIQFACSLKNFILKTENRIG